MNKYNDLELSILSCIVQKPELMDQVILDDKYFVKHKKIWLFMKSFYNKFHNFDFALMYSICKDKYRIVEYIMWLMEKEPRLFLFNDYQKQLMELYDELEKEKYIIEKIYSLANDLYVRSITSDEFKIKLNDIYKNADEIFRKEEKDENN